MIKHPKKTMLLCIATALAVVSSTPVVFGATSLAPGDSNIAIGTSSPTLGTLLASLDSSFNNIGVNGPGTGLSGDLKSQVYTGSGSGYLFVYTLTLNGGLDTAHRFSLANWGDSVLSVDNTGAAGTTAALTADRSSSGATVGFDLPTSPAFPNPGSAQVYVQSNLPDYSTFLNGGSVIDGFSLSVPILAVPEPATIVAGALLLLPFGASTLRNFRRKSVS